jgi:hypothetical protein
VCTKLLNFYCFMLFLTHRGKVLAVNPGASKAVFGVEPRELVGRPLSSFINVFGQWRAKYGDEESLLTTLALRVEQNHDVIVRCGLHNPFSEEEIQQRYGSGSGAKGATAAAAAGDTLRSTADTAGGLGATGGSGNILLTALKSRTKERPAIMTLSMVHAGEEEGGSQAGNDTQADLLAGAGATGEGWHASGARLLLGDCWPEVWGFTPKPSCMQRR